VTRSFGLFAVVAACGARTGLDVIAARDATVYGVDSAEGTEADVSDSGVHPVACGSARVIASQAIQGSGYIDQLVVRGTDIYFSAGGVWHTSVGGITELLGATHSGWPLYSAFDIDPTTIYWASGVNETDVDASYVMYAPRDGGAASLMGTIAAPFFSQVGATDGGVFVWSYQYPCDIDIVGVDASVAALTQLFTAPARLIATSSGAYLGSTDGLFAWDGRSSLAMLSPIGVADFTIDGDSIVFTEAANGATAVSVWRIPIGEQDAAQAVPLVNAYSLFLGGVAVDDASVYFCDRVVQTVVRVTKTSGQVSVVATDDEGGQIIDVALDDACVYWTAADLGGGTNRVSVTSK